MKKILLLISAVSLTLSFNQLFVSAADITLSNGQVWAGADEAGLVTWTQANSACASGYHLPSLTEWQEIKFGTSLSNTLWALGEDFGGGRNYWTSDLFEANVNEAKLWHLEGSYNSVARAPIIGTHRVRCIKDVGNSAIINSAIKNISVTAIPGATSGKTKVLATAASGGALRYSLAAWSTPVPSSTVNLNSLQVFTSGVEIGLYGEGIPSSTQFYVDVYEILDGKLIGYGEHKILSGEVASTGGSSSLSPITTSAPAISRVTSSSALATQAINKNGTGHYWIQLETLGCPSLDIVLSSTVLSFDMMANILTDVSLTPLLPNTSYNYCFAAKDREGNAQTTVSVLKFKTPAVGGSTTCTYSTPATGYHLVQGPSYNSNTNCGLILSLDPATTCAAGMVWNTQTNACACISGTLSGGLCVASSNQPAGSTGQPSGSNSPNPSPSSSSCVNLTQNTSTDAVNNSDSTTNGEVSLLQRFLIDQGYFSIANLPVASPTGWFGPQTKKAVMLFQADKNISPIGSVGPLTRPAIQTLSCSGVKNTASAASLTNLERALANTTNYGSTTPSTTNNTATSPYYYHSPTPISALSSCSAPLNNRIDKYGSCEIGQGFGVSLMQNTCYFGSCTDCKYLSTEQRQLGYNAQTCASTAAIEYKWKTHPYANFGGKPAVCSPNPTVGASCSAGTGDCTSSTNDLTIFSCEDTRVTTGLILNGKVIDEQGNGLAGVTVTLYKPLLGTMAEVLTDSSGDWVTPSMGTAADYAWFHKKIGYDQNSRMGLTAGGKQATWTMKRLQPLVISPSTVELAREDAATASMVLDNFDSETDVTGSDPQLEICAAKNATSCTSFISYKAYTDNAMANYYMTGGNGLAFTGLSNRTSTVSFRYDPIHFSGVTTTNNMFFAVRRKSDPLNVSTAKLNLVEAVHTWKLSSTSSTSDGKLSFGVGPCPTGTQAGNVCSMSNVTGTGSCDLVDRTGPGYRRFSCSLAASTISDVTMTPSYSTMSMSTKLPVNIVVNGISNSINNTKVCYEVLAHPNVPSAVNAGNCASESGYSSFAGNGDWTPTSSGWVGNIKYDASVYGANGIKVKVYFMDATTKRSASATIEVVGGSISETADTTAQILWNGSAYTTNVDPSSTHTLAWASTNADTLVQSKVEFTRCENGNNRTIDPWNPWVGGSGTAFNGSSANAGSPNDAGCYINATYKVKNSVTGKVVTSTAFMAYKSSSALQPVVLPGGLSACPSDISSLGILTCDSSSREHQTITSCVPSDYSNSNTWNWTKTPTNSWDHTTGKSCVNPNVPLSVPTATFTLNGGQRSVTIKAGELATKTWSSTNGSSYDATWSATGSCSDANTGNHHWPGIDGKNPAGDTESYMGAGNQVGCTYTITYKVTGVAGQVASDSASITVVADPAVTPACFIDPVAYYYYYNPDVKAAGMDALTHWNTYGYKLIEGPRKSCWSPPEGFVSTSGTGSGPQVLGAYVSSVACLDLSSNMHRGAESSSVLRLQDFLVQKGLLNEATGFYGDKTVEAVNKYQKNKGLPVTGMVYGATRETIKNETCK